jgi:3-oxoacyl-[acyl-carrier-protein] synthase II
VLVLEELEHARARGARIYAEWSGAATSNDAFDKVAASEDGHGVGQAMRDALRRACLAPEDIDYINAHGTATPLNDLTETQAIKSVFGPRSREIAVSSTKSMHGHLVGAAGALELVISTLALQQQRVPPTAHLHLPDPECDLDYVPHTGRAARVRAAMSNSFAVGGTAATLVVREPQR